MGLEVKKTAIKNLKVLLVSPSCKDTYTFRQLVNYPPLGLLYLAAVLEKEGHAVEVIDLDIDGFTEEGIGKKAKEGNFDFVGITSVTSTINNAFRIAESVKKESGKLTVLGGIHATSVPLECIENPFIDIVVKGEGEITVK
ncbi:MAG: cobalamin-dependent protein [Candidatus Diapherotrites archaeon]